MIFGETTKIIRKHDDKRHPVRLLSATSHTQEQSMKRIVWTFGLIAGAVLSVMMLLTVPFMDRIGNDHGEVIGYTTMVVAFLMVYFGIRTYRDSVMGGTIRFGQAFKVGILITLIACVCYVVTWEVLY